MSRLRDRCIARIPVLRPALGGARRCRSLPAARRETSAAGSWRFARPPVLGLLVLLLAAGCGSERIDATYGRRRGSFGGQSINGTGVLAEMFQRAGYQVSTWTRLSPRLEQFDTLVWAPDRFAPPSKQEREYLEKWLRNEPRRTLVYIGRDYDAEIEYWKQVLPEAPPEQVMEINRRLAEAQARHAERRTRIPEDEYARWFVVRRGDGRRRADQLRSPASKQGGAEQGRSEQDPSEQGGTRQGGARQGGARQGGAEEPAGGNWLDDLDPAKTDIVLESYLDVPRAKDVPSGEPRDLLDARVLLAAGDVPLVIRLTDRRWNGSQILVVTNGSFLLNMPLVNHEHRKLAARLIEACGPPGEVAFLESGPEGLPTMDEEPDALYPTGAEVFTVWPLGVIVLHLVALGILFCFAEFPIFGRPRTRFHVAATRMAASAVVSVLNIVIVRKQRETSESRSDFGNHIAAFGELLERTGDVAYARARLDHYHQHVRRDASAAVADRAPQGTPAPPSPSASTTTGSVPHE